jgi:hypothetical protein
VTTTTTTIDKLAATCLPQYNYGLRFDALNAVYPQQIGDFPVGPFPSGEGCCEACAVYPGCVAYASEFNTNCLLFIAAAGTVGDNPSPVCPSGVIQLQVLHNAEPDPGNYIYGIGPCGVTGNIPPGVFNDN